jgi:hypothetical protein
MNQLKNTYQALGKPEEAHAAEKKQKQVEKMANSEEGRKKMHISNKTKIQGKRVNNLVVLEINSRDKHKNIKWLCKCDCGKQTIKTTAQLNRGVISCGCAISKAMKRRATHNKTNTRTYRIWAGMIQRCTNSKNHKYQRYGARGITVCDSWKKFSEFLNDMGECPNGMQIDRINNDGNYTKENCQWADVITQARNRSNNKIIEMNGIKKTMIEWCEELKISPVAVRMRIHRGWNPIESLTRKLRIW